MLVPVLIREPWAQNEMRENSRGQEDRFDRTDQPAGRHSGYGLPQRRSMRPSQGSGSRRYYVLA